MAVIHKEAHYRGLMQDRFKQRDFGRQFKIERTKCVALWTGYVVIENSGTTYWSENNPPQLINTLQFQMIGERVPEYIVLGSSNHFFLRCSDNSIYYAASDDFDSVIQKNREKVVEKVAFGPRDCWFIMFEDGCMEWNNLPRDLFNKVNGRNYSLPWLQEISISPTGAWFVKFEDGTWEVAGIGDDVRQEMNEIDGEGGEIMYVVLGSTNSYFISYSLPKNVSVQTNDSAINSI